TASHVDTFLRMVEARLDRLLSIRILMNRAVLSLIEGTSYYATPADMLSIRDIQVNRDGVMITPVYVNPETMNNNMSGASDELVYTFINNQIQINPVFHADQMEVVYMQRVPNLTAAEPNNVIAKAAPDVYIFGLLVEICAFAKDTASSEMWNQRFKGAVAELQAEDDKSRWSGPSLRIRLG
ncbi:hypothetical protein DRQ25_10020, partial [Candidatus Fermentibacteria bacterium]